MDVERWLPVLGYEGHYEVSDQGAVRSVDRLTPNRAGGRLQPRRGKPMKLRLGTRRYLIVRLSGPARRTRTVHQLVAEAFHGPRPSPELEVRHLDGNAFNNTAANLAWGTKAQNAQDSIAHGTATFRRRDRRSRDHPLVEPNLTRCGLAVGKRRCLACARSYHDLYAAQKRGEPFDMQAQSDRRFALIMGGTQ